jgi:hypothetical protein
LSGAAIADFAKPLGTNLVFDALEAFVVAEAVGALKRTPPPWRHREKISTAFAESAVNQVVRKRMVEKQQMRWGESGAHNLLQVRTKVLNDQLRETFVSWYPGMQTEQETEIEKKAG